MARSLQLSSAPAPLNHRYGMRPHGWENSPGRKLFCTFGKVHPAKTAELDSNGVADRTVVPSKKRVLVYIVDLKDKLRAKVLTAAQRLHARLSFIKGQGELIGDDDREKAQAVFEREVLKYEVSHPRVRQGCRKKDVQQAASLLMGTH